MASGNGLLRRGEAVWEEFDWGNGAKARSRRIRADEGRRGGLPFSPLFCDSMVRWCGWGCCGAFAPDFWRMERAFGSWAHCSGCGFMRISGIVFVA